MAGNINVRAVALDIIYDVLENGVFYNTSFLSYIEGKNLDKRDKSFISSLSYGTLERSIELDYIISFYSSKPLKKLKPYIRNILRLSVYQMKYMTHVPVRAIVNEGVNLAAGRGYGGLKGFVNGVLRNIARSINDIKYPDEAEDGIRYLSVTYSMPEWIVRHYLAEMEYEQVKGMLDYFLHEKSLTIRCTGNIYDKKQLMSQFSDNGILCETDTIFDYALRLNKQGDVSKLFGYNEGSFVVQNESSMIPAHIGAELLKGEDSPLVIDMCAAPGGKALMLAQALGNAVISARDVNKEKLRRIEDNCKRLNITNIYTKIWDGCITDTEYIDKCGLIIADVPCSGLGVMAGKCDIKHNASPEGMKELSNIQRMILNNAAAYVRKGGYILYSTCTLNKEENEENIEAFIEKENNSFSIINAADYLPDSLKDFVTDKGYVKVIPGKVRADGFFVCILKRIN